MSRLEESLRSLPEFDPPPGGWTRLQRRLEEQRLVRRRRYGGLALAASMLLAVGVGVLLPRTAAVPVVPSSSPSSSVAADAAGDEVVRLKQRSRELEQRLAQVQPQVQVWDNRLAGETARLERDLLLVDLQINHAQEPESARRLWRNRVALMSQLVQTHRQAALMPVAYVTQETSL